MKIFLFVQTDIMDHVGKAFRKESLLIATTSMMIDVVSDINNCVFLSARDQKVLYRPVKVRTDSVLPWVPTGYNRMG